jgi:acyl transferase domain-containing protein/NAD(P)H-dependent flavin oxidoreductase YrpB (nitropropane dioxygenase family)/NADP-dependent 3-hydroxy acid dehydrogenase YdfG
MASHPLPRRLLVLGAPGAHGVETAAAAAATGAVGVCDLGMTAAAAADILLQARDLDGRVGVRVSAECPLAAEEVFGDRIGRFELVVLGVHSPWTPRTVADQDADVVVLCEVTSLDEATAAVAAGAYGVIAVGNEAGGTVGPLSSFVLFQQLVARLEVPVWVRGGVGRHAAAGLVAAGAAGVVLDVALGLLGNSSGWPRGVLERMDGSETVVRDGRRVLHRPTSGDPADGLPIGQDGALAPLFAQRYVDVADAVRDVLGGIDRAVDRAVHHALGAAPGPVRPDALAADGPLARALGTRLPIAQGPMTRVSDRAGFASAVAEHGGLPFVALALASGEQAETLLADTAEALGGRPWGAGLLGFVPEEVRAAQFAAVRRVHPPFALLAGGRPAQAAALEADGIGTFLHVPSPVLLRQYLAAGARRFVFEGAECGGHIGPRSSLVLWEAQLTELGRFLDATPTEGIQVLFAGGVHDARSAAVVSVMAAPLAARGVAVGVLMGTAYLFTDEAVEHGAITETFREQAVAALGTATVETAPGHVTRCLSGPIVEAFDARRTQLRERGLEPTAIWQELEAFSTGRLRIASKGIRRQGAELVEVDRAGQLADGMFMAGQVVALRSATTHIAALHAEVGPGAEALLAARRAELTTLEPASEAPLGRPLDVAVVGVACVLPGAPDVDTFWTNILAGHDAVTEVPRDRWDTEVYGEASTSRYGAFLEPQPFDPLAYGIPPASLASIDPAQLLSLEVAARALRDAGYAPLTNAPGSDFDRTRTSVIFGAEAGGDLANAVALRSLLPGYTGEIPAELDAQLPRYTEDVFPGTLANVIAGRIANRLDLGGTNFTVDAACGSSLAALDVACKELTTGGSDMVLCGAVDLHNGINDYLLFTAAGALSATGRCRPFDGAADGIALGEGAVCLVLKRLTDAQRDGDTVYAVVKGVGGASDGRSLGLTAPRPEGQRRALERAYRQAAVAPAEVELVEAHGTGTVVGDRTELTTLTRFFAEAGAGPASCALGSVKSQIGHTKCAAGLAGLLKAVLALRHGILPPTVHVTSPNQAWDADTSPFTLSGDPRPWPTPVTGRAAGVSAFGFGGTNFHAVLTAGPAATPARRTVSTRPAELVLLHGADDDGARNAARELAAFLDSRPDLTLGEVADEAADASERSRQPVRWGLVCADRAELAGLLHRIAAGERPVGPGVIATEPGAGPGEPGRVAFLFSGQGAQRTGMGAELFATFGELRPLLDLAAPWIPTIYPPAAFTPAATAAQDVALRDTRAAQPAIGLVGTALNAVLHRLGIQPDLLGGHSYGEVVALCAAGAYDAATLLRLSSARATAIVEAAAASGFPGGDTGAMAAVRAGSAEVARALAATGLAGSVVTANQNSPRQTVISGATPCVERAVAALREHGLAAKRIPVSCAFHSPLVASSRDVFAADLAGVDIRAPERPVWSNRTAAPYPGDPAAVRAEMADQICAPVRFVDQVESMYAAGGRTFVEVGPGSVLTGLVGAILGDRPHLAVATDAAPGGSGLRALLISVARLGVAGVPVRPGWLGQGRRRARRSTSSLIRNRPGWTVDGARVRTADGVPVPGSLLPARLIERPIMTGTTHDSVPSAANGASAADGLVAEFLRTSREMIAAQRDVLLGYLGATGGHSSLPALAAPPAPLPLDRAAALTELPTAAPADVPAATPAGSAAVAAHGTASEPPLPAPADSAPPFAGDLLGAVVAEIAERTGYPPEMIDANLDLEADLSVDSIKRTEIVGGLVELLGLSGRVDGELLETLGTSRTAQAIADLLDTASPAGAATAEPTVPAAPTAAAAVATTEPGEPTARTESVESAVAAAARAATPARAAQPSGPTAGLVRAPQRLVPRLVPVSEPARSPERLRGARVVVLAGPGQEPTGAVVGAALTEAGAVVEARDSRWTPSGPVDVVICLDPLREQDEQVAPRMFALVRDAVRHDVGQVLVVAARPGAPRTHPHTAGLTGMARALHRELPGSGTWVLELEPDPDDETVAAAVVIELTVDAAPPAVHRTARGRLTTEVTPERLPAVGHTGAGPSAFGTAEAEAAGLDEDAVVLLIGGARGITAQLATAIATAGRCRLELVGRTLWPAEPEGPATEGIVDPAALRTAIAGAGASTPAEVESRLRTLLAQREVAATLDAVEAAGGRARYHCADARDRAALTQVVKTVLADHGRLDGVVHAAGIIEDRLLADKDPASFTRVFATKVDVALGLFDALDELSLAPSFVVQFGSVAAVYGNRGQIDYAAANDALESIGTAWAERTGHRVLTVHWGPWAPSEGHAGMVGPELARDYARRDIRLVDPEEGVVALLRELAYGPRELRSVVYTASEW